MYRSSAKLVRYLANRYHIPLDRQHILGHDDVANDGNYANSHWDPGPFWDWDRYLGLLHGGTAQPNTAGRLVVVRPRFSTNRPPLRYCDSTGCRDLLLYCHHSARINADWLPDETLVSSLCPGMVCRHFQN